MAQLLDTKQMIQELLQAKVILISDEYNYIVHMYDVFMLPPAWESKKFSEDFTINQKQYQWKVRSCS